ncbi:alpha/beta hydrolase fold containing protein [Tritrichomonas foetus]|uniref:Alpha/beta hydrolase fold containing protein n=1 Tax=Tritrichomonas foetus TaxID=1144522 RepID=A0A1J4KDT9_9EUKA|nr:alpha/beta hydrolase fold containing protein [Tritrichomonas foetus]|eukprot:OHT09154.1 alpha/beta hydrolase fold containing protein [Tritrichomonas foetus]
MAESKPLRYFLQSPNSKSSTTQYGNNAEVGKYVQVEDAQIYYEVYGKGKPFVVLHGGGVGCAYEMGCFVDKLIEKYQVCLISTRGHGKSEIGTKEYTYEMKATDVCAVIEEFTKESVIVLGFSDGAYTGYKLASMYPDRVERLIAIGAGELIPGLRKVMMNYDEFYRQDPDYINQQLSLMPKPDRLREFWKTYSDFWNKVTVSKELFFSIKCPVLLICGELDGNAPLDTVLATYRMIRKCNLSVIPNAGHVCFIDNFPAVWAAIEPFLNQ